MSSLNKNDRVSLCSFTFSDGRRCRAPRTGKNPRFCFYHAQKEARARAAKSLGKDLAYFFSGDYLSACDLSTALSRLIPAVVRGDVKPKTAHTVAYLSQTLLQAIHIGQHEYINAFGTDGWRNSIRNSVNDNYNYRFPSDPQPPAAQIAPACHPERSEGSHPNHAASAASQTPPMPPTSAEFVQQVLAGLQPGSLPATPHIQPAQAQPPASPPAETPVNCHSERSEQPAFSSSPAPSLPSPHAPQQPASPPAETPVNCHSERSEEPAFSSSPAPSPSSPRAPLPPAAQPAPLIAPAPQPNNPPQPPPPPPRREPDRSAPWLNWGDVGRIPPDSKLL